MCRPYNSKCCSVASVCHKKTPPKNGSIVLCFFFSQFLKHVWWLCACEITFPLWKKNPSQFLIRRCCMCSHFVSVCVCVCVPGRLGVYPGLQLPVRGPLEFPARCARVLVSGCVCAHTRQDSLLWAPCCHRGKPIMGRARVSGTPPTNILQTHRFPLICMDANAKRRLSGFLLPSGDWAERFLLSLMWN